MKVNHLTPVMLFILLALNLPAVNAQPPKVFTSTSAQQLQTCLKRKDFFALRSSFDQLQKKLTRCELLYFKAYLDNSFNRCKLSEKEIEKLIRSYGTELTDVMVGNLLKLQIDNDVKTFQYKKAAQISDLLVKSYSLALDSADMEDVKNSNIIWHSLAEVPAQKFNQLTNSHIPWKRDIAGLMTVPISIDGQSSDFVFDTGANFCTISRIYALQYHLQMIETAFKLGSSTSVNTIASVAVAEKLIIGNIELRNVVFLVLPDEQLIFPKINYAIHGIIGFPVISEFEELHINKAGMMSVLKSSSKSTLRNLVLDGLLPIISLRTDSDTLAYRFDSGAQQTELFSPYFKRHKDEVMRTGIADSTNRGGAGGSLKTFSYKIPQFKVYTNDKLVQLNNVTVLPTPIKNEEEYYYGNIGQDLIGQFNEMVINFKQMFILFL